MSEFQTRWRWKTHILPVPATSVEVDKLDDVLNSGWQPTKTIVGRDYLVFILKRDKEITDDTK